MKLLGRTLTVAVPALPPAAGGDATSSRSAADDPTTSPSPSISQTSTATPTVTPSQGGPAGLTLDGLPQGAPPAVSYLSADPDAFVLPPR
jgi:hypothetical protein